MKKYRIDLNCDLGEGEPLRRTEALMRWVTSANVACGGHAGDVASMDRCVKLAKKYGVRLGAHPGYPDRQNFGRKELAITPSELELLLMQQVSALAIIERHHGSSLHHIKLHGGLYHMVERSPALARRYLAVVRRYWPGARVYARSGGTVARLGRGSRVEVWNEAFADRAYDSDGALIARDRADALLDAGRACQQVLDILEIGNVLSPEGRQVIVEADTLCLHSDTPGAVVIARRVASLLREGS